MITQTARHAINALAELARLEPGRRAGAAEVARRIGAPPNYLGKLLQTLAQQGLLESRKGKGGGYRLARPPERISLFDVADPIEHLGARTGCFLGQAQCSDRAACAVHARWGPIRDAYVAFLQQTTIADLIGTGAAGGRAPDALGMAASPDGSLGR